MSRVEMWPQRLDDLVAEQRAPLRQGKELHELDRPLARPARLVNSSSGDDDREAAEQLDPHPFASLGHANSQSGTVLVPVAQDGSPLVRQQISRICRVVGCANNRGDVPINRVTWPG
jgi:hypothetical protein